VASLLQQLAAPPIQDLLAHIDMRRFSQDPAVLDALLRTVVNAVGERDTARALGALAQLIALQPERGESLLREPGLVPIQGAVRDLLQRLELEARTGAEQTLIVASAANAVAGRDFDRALASLAQL